MEELVYLSLGSNLGDRFKFLEDALLKIENRCGTIKAVSPFYESEPVGFVSENQFINLCLALETNLSPKILLKQTQAIEKESGRNKSGDSNYVSRNLDIDIIFYSNQTISSRTLSIPHPKYHERKFVLQPLNDIASNFIDPTSELSVNHLLNICLDDTEVSEIKNDKRSE